jgi:hypothetical protein
MSLLPNRYLPDWLHRVANGAAGGAVSSLAAVAIVRLLNVPLWALWFVLPAAIICMAIDPHRFSLVEGCAGDLGYDELRDEAAEKPDDQSWSEAHDG